MKPLMKYHVTLDAKDGSKINSWGVFPIGPSKILDGLYNPETKSLSLLFDSITEQYKAFEVPNKNNKPEIQHRKIDTYYDFSLPEEDIQFFLDNYVENNFTVAVENSIIINGV